MSERTISPAERKALRDLATRWMDHAANPAMGERKRLWKSVHDLKPVRPAILVETASVQGYVEAAELQCTNPFLRAVERTMLETVRHADEVGDDIVIEPWYRCAWKLGLSDFGVKVEQEPAPLMSNHETSIGYTFNFPLKKPGDISLLKKRCISVDREKTALFKSLLEDAMGNILPVRVGNYDPFEADPAGEGFCGNFFFGLTWQLYRFIGNDGLLYWVYDAPQAIHRLMEYMRDDRIALFEFLEREGLLAPNADTQMAGPRAYGYVSDLPGPDHTGPLSLKDLWCWAESQETTTISPSMYKEFILPYLADLSARFGLVYYGCCEPVHDRLELIMAAIPNLRSVSVSGWSDFMKVGEMLGSRYVYSRKPIASFLSGVNPPWDLAREDMLKTRRATRNSSVEILFRDLYTINNERSRLAEWVRMTKSVFDI